MIKEFLSQEPLSVGFPPCKTGGRERDFHKLIKQAIDCELSVMALDGSRVIGACINTNLKREDVFNFELEIEDRFLLEMELLITGIHRKLDLFSKLNTDRLFELSFLAVNKSYAGRGLGTKLMYESLKLGGQECFKVAKGDSTGPASVAVHKKLGLEEIHRVYYDDYKVDGKVLFPNTPTRGSHLTVLACRLQDSPPYILPLGVTFDQK